MLNNKLPVVPCRGDIPAARMSFELAASLGNPDALYSLACIVERQVGPSPPLLSVALQSFLAVPPPAAPLQLSPLPFPSQATVSELVVHSSLEEGRDVRGEVRYES